MLTVRARNVNEAYTTGRREIMRIGSGSGSRAGSVLVAPYPVTTVYAKPCERVLFDESRDANPFFHLFESLWMLSGSRDATWLDRFVGDFSSRFAEADGHQWGAYGHRWRQYFKFDQLTTVVDRLREKPDDRRVVIAMWDPQSDLISPREDGWEPADLPCNTHLYPRVHDGRLDLTVCCRSNDIVWGAYGANAVHFSVLQEYLAGRIGVEVGIMYQFSNNWHGYTDVLERMGMPSGDDPYARGQLTPMPMGEDWSEWDEDLGIFMEYQDFEHTTYKNSWFSEVAVPMWTAHRLWKAGDREGAMAAALRVQADDWRRATTQWMERRMRR